MKNNKINLFTKLKSLKPIYYVCIIIVIIGLVIGILFLVKQFQTKNTNINTNTNTHTLIKGKLESHLSVDPKPNTAANVSGYYNWTWGGNGGGNPTGNWNIGILFGGEDPITAIKNNISNSFKISAPIKYLNLGGGDNPNGWSLESIEYVNSRLQDIKQNHWNGICFDVEACPTNVNFISAFQKCFANCKNSGLQVFITISGTVPWACKTGSGQGAELVNSWINDSNIDYISPQLYGGDGRTLVTSDLSKFSNSKAKIIPSIPYAKDWDAIQNLGIKPYGYIVWNHDNTIPPSNNNICGATWSDAANNCKGGNPKFCNNDGDCAGQSCYKFPCYSDKKCGFDYTDAVTNCIKNSDCPSGTDADCPSGQHCFAVPKVCA
jgi:hypothetical protein